MRKKQQGFTLTEILLVIGFIALASVLVVRMAVGTERSSKASAEARNIHVLAKALWTGPGMLGFYPYVSTAGMNSGNLTPDYMRDPSNANRIVNGFGSDINVTPATYLANGLTYNGFSIATTNIPFDYCTSIVNEAGGDFDQISVQGVFVKTIDNSTIDESQLTGACETATNVTIDFYSFE